MGVSTIRQFVPETCSAIYQVLKEKYMKVIRTTFSFILLNVCNESSVNHKNDIVLFFSSQKQWKSGSG